MFPPAKIQIIDHRGGLRRHGGKAFVAPVSGLTAVVLPPEQQRTVPMLGGLMGWIVGNLCAVILFSSVAVPDSAVAADLRKRNVKGDSASLLHC